MRRASTVILVARNNAASLPIPLTATATITQPQTKTSGILHSTSTSNPLNVLGCEHSVLLVKRSTTNRFMSGQHVFPGGVVEPTGDYDPRWILFCGWSGDKDELAHRIAAIRELFEEVNVLLSSQDLFANGKQEEIQSWRKDVQKDSSKFYHMCRHFSVRPQVHLLHKWSHWITPTFEKYRYDTKFYVSIFDTMPVATIDAEEVTQLDWLTPQQALTSFSKGLIALPPPTWVTLNQLTPHTTIDLLLQHCQNLPPFGTPWLPIKLEPPTDEGFVLLLPGDTSYPGSDTETKGGSNNLHRMIMAPNRTYKYINGPTTLYSHHSAKL